MGLKRGERTPQISTCIIKLKKKCFEYIVWCSGLDRHGMKERMCRHRRQKWGNYGGPHPGESQKWATAFGKIKSQGLGGLRWAHRDAQEAGRPSLTWGASSCATSEPCITSLILLDVVHVNLGSFDCYPSLVLIRATFSFSHSSSVIFFCS